jgi:CubicO group peptidase (beta-lactamase class C family)
VRFVVAMLAVALASVPAGSAARAAPLAQTVQTAARRAGFNGEVAVARHGRIVFARGFGQADRAHGRRVTLDTAFNLASMGKMFTGVAAAQLVQAGKLRFSDRIGKYLPQLPPPLRAITVAQLLDHTSGLGDFFGDPGYPRVRPTLTSLAAYLPLVTRERPRFAPGTRWSYSNSGFLLAGLVIQKASAESYDAYLARHVWKPAGMTHTGCYPRSSLPKFAAIGYLSGGASNTTSLPPAGTSAGGCYSSARDLIAFAGALEADRLASRALTNLITTSKVRAPGGGYGFGFGIRTGHPGDPPTIWHNGGAPGAAGELDINPKLGIVAVTLGNVEPPQVFPVVDALLNKLHVP